MAYNKFHAQPLRTESYLPTNSYLDQQTRTCWLRPSPKCSQYDPLSRPKSEPLSYKEHRRGYAGAYKSIFPRQPWHTKLSNKLEPSGPLQGRTWAGPCFPRGKLSCIGRNSYRHFLCPLSRDGHISIEVSVCEEVGLKSSLSDSCALLQSKRSSLGLFLPFANEHKSGSHRAEVQAFPSHGAETQQTHHTVPSCRQPPQ